MRQERLKIKGFKKEKYTNRKTRKIVNREKKILGNTQGIKSERERKREEREREVETDERRWKRKRNS